MAPSTLDPTDLPAALRIVIEADAKEAEAQGNMTTRVCTALRDSGAFRLLTPREFGGWETPLTTALTIYEHFGHIDASIGALVWNLNMGFIAALLPDSGTHRIFTGTEEPILANSGTPGAAERVHGGYRVTGRWPIVSGVDFADWVVLVVTIAENGRPTPGRSEPTQPWFAVLHREQLRIESSWDVTAMRATGSNTVVVENAFVADNLAAPLVGPPVIDRELYRGYLPSIVFPGCSAVLLGVTDAALDELVSLIAPRRTADNHRVQYLVARSEAQLSAARLLLHDAAGSLQESARTGALVTTCHRARLRAAMSNVAEVCTEILATAYHLSGSAALYRFNRIECLYRDGMALAQHGLQSSQFLELAGRVRLGIEPGLPMY